MNKKHENKKDESNKLKRKRIRDKKTVSRRKTLASLFSLPIAVKMASQQAAAFPKPDSSDVPRTTASGSITNNDVSVFVDNNGEFELTTAGGEQLTFPRASTSGLTVQVDGTNYVIGTPPGTDMDQFRTQDTAFSSDGTSATTRWSLPEGVEVTQKISLAGEAVQFDLTIENTGNQNRDVKIRYLIDYQVGPQDGAPIFVNGSVLTSETRFSSPTFDTWQTYDQLPNPSLTGQGTIGTQPEKIEFVAWEDASGSSYTYDGFDSNKDFFTPGETNSPASDSAGLLYYEPGTVAPGDEEQITTFYGVGSPTQTNISELETALNKFGQATTNLLDARIETRANVHAELYSEVGEEYRRNIVNYLGHAADIDGYDGDDVNTDFRDRLDSLTEGFGNSTFESLFNFFDEMFRQVDPEDPLEQIKSTFESYIRGTASGQTHRLEVNGKQIAGSNSIRRDFLSEFANKQNNALDELRNSSLSDEEISYLINLVNAKRRELTSREQEIRDNTEGIISDIKQGNEMRTHAQRLTGSSVNDSSVQPTALSLAALGAIGIKAGGAAALAAIKTAGAKLATTGTLKVAAGSSVGIYGGSAALSSLSWSQYSIGTWSMLQAWGANASSALSSGAKVVAKEYVRSKVLEELGLSPDEIISDYTGVEIDIIINKRDLAVTVVELALDNIVEVAQESGKEVVVEEVRAPNLDTGGVVSGQATETAEVDLRNPMSSDSVQPRIVLEDTEIKSTPLTNPFTSEVPSYLTVQPGRSDSDLPEIPPGETRTIEIEYNFPTNYTPGRYKLQVTASPTRSSLPREHSTDVDSFIVTGSLIDPPDLETLQSGVIDQGQSNSSQTTVDTSVESSTFDLTYGGSDLDLHLYDEADNHVGVNYNTGEFENQIPGATATGQDNGEGSEGITVDNPSGSYETEVVAVQTSDQGTDYSVDSFDVSDTDPVINVIPSEIQVSREPSESATRTVTIEEGAGFNGLTGVSITPSDLSGSGGEMIASSNVSVSASELDIGADSSRSISLDVSVPDDTPSGTYVGQITVTANQGAQSVSIPLTVEVRLDTIEAIRQAGDNPNELERESIQDAIFEFVTRDNPTFNGAEITREGLQDAIFEFVAS